MRVESFNGALVITLLVIGLILIIGSQIASVRAGAAGLFAKAGSLLSPLGALGARLAGSSGLRLLAIPLVLGLVWGGVEFVKHQGRLEERLKDASADRQLAEHEGALERKAGELGINTTRERARRASVIAEVEQELDHAVEVGDLEGLYERYFSAHCSLLPHPGCADSADPTPRGIEGVRRPRADAA